MTEPDTYCDNYTRRRFKNLKEIYSILEKDSYCRDIQKQMDEEYSMLNILCESEAHSYSLFRKLSNGLKGCIVKRIVRNQKFYYINIKNKEDGNLS